MEHILFVEASYIDVMAGLIQTAEIAESEGFPGVAERCRAQHARIEDASDMNRCLGTDAAIIVRLNQ